MILGVDMMTLQDIRNNKEILNMIDWGMTPEEAVTLYLEWGNNWSHGNMVKSKNDMSHYFVINTWERPTKVYLIRRNSDEAVEMAAFPLPTDLEKGFLESVGNNKGVYALNDEVKSWLKKALGTDLQ
jgi:hypothetical protein